MVLLSGPRVLDHLVLANTKSISMPADPSDMDSDFSESIRLPRVSRIDIEGGHLKQVLGSTISSIVETGKQMGPIRADAFGASALQRVT